MERPRAFVLDHTRAKFLTLLGVGLERHQALALDPSFRGQSLRILRHSASVSIAARLVTSREVRKQSAAMSADVPFERACCPPGRALRESAGRRSGNQSL